MNKKETIQKVFDNVKIEQKYKPQIAIITPWFNRGLAYVGKQIRELLISFDCDVHIFATQTSFDRPPSVDDVLPDWQVPNLTITDNLPNATLRYVANNSFDLIIFLEVFEENTIKFCHKLGIRTILIPMYEWIQDNLRDLYPLFTKIVCPAVCTYVLIKNEYALENLGDIQWAIKPIEIKEKIRSNETILFYNAGWGGHEDRKNNEAVIKAFKVVGKKMPGKFKLIFKAQKRLREIEAMIEKLSKPAQKSIEYITKDITKEELYKLYERADIVLNPSKREGLGLPVLEALALGKPVVCTDIVPMNQFVRNGVNGYTVEKTVCNTFNKIKSYNIDIDDFANKIMKCSENWSSFNSEKIRSIEQEQYEQFVSFWKILIGSFQIKKQLKIAHFSLFGPNISGMYHTTKDMVIGECREGLHARFIATDDKVDKCLPSNYDERENFITTNEGWANDADILVLHSLIPEKLFNSGKSIIMIVHAQPYHLFLDEMYVSKQPYYTELIEYAKDMRIQALVTLWQSHLPFLQAIAPDKSCFVSAPVDTEIFSPDGYKYNYEANGIEKSKPCIVFLDSWRILKDPFLVLHAFKLFVEKYPEAKLHLYGLQDKYAKWWNDLIDVIGIRENIGELLNNICNPEWVYRACDFVVTTRGFETRVIREATACGKPIVTGGWSEGEYNCYPEDSQSMCDAMKKCWQDIQRGKNLVPKLSSVSSLQDCAKEFINLYNKALEFKPINQPIVEIVVDSKSEGKMNGLINKTLELSDLKKPEYASVSKKLYDILDYCRQNDLPVRHDGKDNPDWRIWEYSHGIVNLKLDKNMEILDIGSGGSILALYLAKQGYNITCIDGDFYAIENTNIIVSNMKLTIETVNMEVSSYSRKQFDRIFCVGTLGEMGDKVSAIKKMKELLKEEGVIYITFDFGTGSPYNPIKSTKELIAIVEKAGMKLIGQEFVDLTDWNNPPVYLSYTIGSLFIM